MNILFGPCAARVDRVEPMDFPGISDDALRSVLIGREKIDAFFQADERVFQFLKSCLDPVSSAKICTVLVAQCGSGGLAQKIVEWGRNHNVGMKVLAVDSSARNIQIAKKRFASVTSIQFDKKDLTNPQFLLAQQFDFVFCVGSFHCLDFEAGVEALKIIARLARKGYLVVDLLRDIRPYVLMKTLSFFEANRDLKKYFPMWVLNSFSVSELEGMIAEAGNTHAELRTILGCLYEIEQRRGFEFVPSLSFAT